MYGKYHQSPKSFTEFFSTIRKTPIRQIIWLARREGWISGVSNSISWEFTEDINQPQKDSSDISKKIEKLYLFGFIHRALGKGAIHERFLVISYYVVEF